MSYLNLDLFFLDYVVLIFTVLIIIFSFWKGFINSVLGLLTWIGSVFITIYTYNFISEFLNSLILNIDYLSNFEDFISILSIIISIPLVFLISLFILKRIRKILSSDLDRQILGLIIDKFFGLLYGLLFSYVICSTLVFFTKNNSVNFLDNLNNYLINNSNILKQINNYNENIFEIYINDTE